MKDIRTEKIKLRKEIALQKSKLSAQEIAMRSEEVLGTLEALDIFQTAKNIFIYSGMSDEVQTMDFIERWKTEKNFYLPVIIGDDIFFRRYTSKSALKAASLGILEPEGENYTDYRKVDLVIVPGVAFDRKMNRLGRGKGYYDRFLSTTSIPKVGICFDIQLKELIPSDNHDTKMNYIVSENEIIWQ